MNKIKLKVCTAMSGRHECEYWECLFIKIIHTHSHIQAETKWSTFCIQHLQLHFVCRKFWSWFEFYCLFTLGPICNKSALVHVMAWHRSGETPLPEPMMTHSLPQIWVFQPWWLISLLYVNYICIIDISRTLYLFLLKMHRNPTIQVLPIIN